MAPPIDPHIGDRVVAWYQRWPTAAKVAFWVLGGGVIVVIVAIAWGVARPFVGSATSDRAVEEADTLREAEIARHQRGIDAAEAERAKIRAERAQIAKEKQANARTWKQMGEDLDSAGGPDDVDRIYERIRKRSGD